MDQFKLPNGETVGTGLQMPVTLLSSMPAYVTAGPMLSAAEIEQAARSGKHRGRDRFGSDWVKNQRSHGSCNGFAGATALSKARRRRGLDRVDLSGAYAYSLINGGQDRGSMLEDGMKSIQERGVCRESLVGWDQIYPRQYDKAKADADAKNFRGFECYTIRSETELGSALACDFDVVVAVHADNGFMQLDTRGVAGGGNGPGNHAVASDGIYWDQEILYDTQNSWDTSYGQQGRMYLTFPRHFASTLKNHVFYAIRSASDPTE